MARRVAIGIAFLAPLVGAAEPVSFSSDPSGAKVCQKAANVLRCLGQTPLSRDISFSGPEDSKRYFLKRLGYQTVSVIVSAGQPGADIALKRREVLFPPEEHADAATKKLQAQANEVLAGLIYSPESELAALDAEIIGKIRATVLGGARALYIPMLIDDEAHRRRILAARRSGDGGDRGQRLVRAVMQGAPARLLRVLRGRLKALELDRMVLSVDYQVSLAAVVDETLHYYRTRITSQYVRTNPDGKRELVTEYLTTRHEYDVTKVQDELAIRTVVLEVPVGDANAGTGKLEGLIAASLVYSNDNRHRRFERVDQR